MTVDLRWRARVLVDADRTSMASAAARHGIAAKSISGWRKDLVSDPALARLYAAETEAAVGQFRADLSATISAGLQRLRELIPQATVEDMTVLLNVVRECGEVLVQADALTPRKEPADASPADRGRTPDATDPEVDSGDSRH